MDSQTFKLSRRAMRRVIQGDAMIDTRAKFQGISQEIISKDAQLADIARIGGLLLSDNDEATS